MHKDKIAINLFFSDNQFDVEVYKWDEKTNQASGELGYLSNYGLVSENVVESYIDKLRREYELMDITHTSENDDKEEYFLPTPDYLTYIFSCTSTLEKTLEELFYKKNGFKLKLDIKEDSEYLYFNPSSENDAVVIEKLKRYYPDYANGGSFKEELLCDLFDSYGVTYSVPMDDRGDVHILVPYDKHKNLA